MAGVIVLTGVATAAAQDSTAQAPVLRTSSAIQQFSFEPSGQVRNFSIYKSVADGFTGSSTAPMRAAGAMTWNGVVLGGFTSAGGGGFTVGGGAQGSNLANHEEFGLLIDFLYANVGGCDLCDVFGEDFSAHTIAISGNFIYLLKEWNNGWRGGAGGGIVWVRFSFSSDLLGFCDFIGGCSSSSAGVQGVFQLEKNKIHIDFRGQSVGGGGAVVLVGYKFGGNK